MVGTLALIILLGYLLGAVPFSLVVGRMKGVDLRQHGSGNAGATNAFRVLGKGPGILVFVLDMVKGLVATQLISRLTMGADPTALLGAEGATWLMVIAGASAMLGHVFTIWGRLFFGSLKGGKGVATGAGMLLGLIPVAVGVGLVVFILTMVATRYVSLGSILAALSLPITLAVQRWLGAEVASPVWLFALAVPLFIVYTHRTNVRRLLNGTEARMSDKAEPVESAE